jgi:hypothetical protein
MANSFQKSQPTAQLPLKNNDGIHNFFELHISGMEKNVRNLGTNTVSALFNPLKA